MQVAVWDTYVKNNTGAVVHFDIIVPDTLKDAERIYSFGKEYIQSWGALPEGLSTEQCRFCHIETPLPEMLSAIADKGYYILEMPTIPASLSSTASRQDKILYLRGHYAQHRFADFRGVPEADIDRILLQP
ncbi:MAG TPA: DUF2024 family protein [Chitinophagaceae bacterium]|nr:DUF2024 family protein [Chitinophagaceae bacterium]